jgi:glycosyltransferase involved in cell wall biosynthesis
MKIALVYDRVSKWGGAERVLLALHEMFPEALLYTSVYDPERAPWAKVFPKVIPSFLQKVPGAKNNHERLAPCMPLAFESFCFDDYELVISVTSEAAKGIITKPQTLHICYCLSPTRYLWSGYEDYFKGATFKDLTKPLVKYLRNWDRIAAQRPDVMIAISTEVRGRIERYYNRQSEVIYPPVNINEFEARGKKFEIEKGNYFLVVSRLVPYKRVDLAIAAFNKLELPLVIVGTGSEEKRLKKMAGTNISFTGQLTEMVLSDYYRGCAALVMPQEEDFGLVAVEAQAAGKPVIAFRKGGVCDTVADGKTGVFFDHQTEKDLMTAVCRFSRMKFNDESCRKSAERFSEERFGKQFLRLVEKLMNG